MKTVCWIPVAGSRINAVLGTGVWRLWSFFLCCFKVSLVFTRAPQTWNKFYVNYSLSSWHGKEGINGIRHKTYETKFGNLNWFHKNVLRWINLKYIWVSWYSILIKLKLGGWLKKFKCWDFYRNSKKEQQVIA